MAYDPIGQDPVRDEAFPAGSAGIEFFSHGALLNGVIYLAVGPGPHRTILLLHGFPGHERNFDLAQILRRAGCNVMVFHYRGCWGSGGDYRFANVLKDVQEAIRFLRNRDTLSRFRIDGDDIVLVGHSLGGWATLMTAAKVQVRAAASIAGANVGYWGRKLREEPETARPWLDELYSENLGPLSGVTAAQLLIETEENAEAWDYIRQSDALAARKLLLVAAERDEVVAFWEHHLPLVEALARAGAPNVTDLLIDSDHAFSDSRIKLARALLAWLETV